MTLDRHGRRAADCPRCDDMQEDGNAHLLVLPGDDEDGDDGEDEDELDAAVLAFSCVDHAYELGRVITVTQGVDDVKPLSENPCPDCEVAITNGRGARINIQGATPLVVGCDEHLAAVRDHRDERLNAGDLT